MTSLYGFHIIEHNEPINKIWFKHHFANYMFKNLLDKNLFTTNIFESALPCEFEEIKKYVINGYVKMNNGVLIFSDRHNFLWIMYESDLQLNALLTKIKLETNGSCY